MDMLPNGSRRVTWALASLNNVDDSLELAKQTATCPWEAEISHLELENKSYELEIQTGDPDWDAVLAFSQKTAYSLFFPSSQALPHPSFVLNRQPDSGYSLRSNGSDYANLWSGQTTLDAYYLSSLILPGGADLVEGLLLNFLSVQEENGFIDWKPGLAGQRSRRLAQPMLATLAFQLAPYREDSEWLRPIYPALLRFLQCWFSPEQDRDGDGFPEWSYPQQTGMEEAPLYNRWHAAFSGVDISAIEMPSLAAMLYQECQSLIRIAQILERPEDIPWLTERRTALAQHLRACWNSNLRIFTGQDARTHRAEAGISLLTWRGSGTFELQQTFQSPRRLHAMIRSADESTHLATMAIFGETPDGGFVEEIMPRAWSWVNGTARYTTSSIFLKIDRIEIAGLQPEDEGSLTTIDFTQSDISQFLPLWAHVPGTIQAQSAIKSLTNLFMRPSGIPACKNSQHPGYPASLSGVSMLWNHLMGEGLLAYGDRTAAADLVTRLMTTLVNNLRTTGRFCELYHAETGSPLGENQTLHGLAPIGLFLRTLGLGPITDHSVIVQGNNPFPWPVTVKYRGMNVTCHGNETSVTFRDGQTIRVNGPGPHRISLD
jgi:hypothetical protein